VSRFYGQHDADGPIILCHRLHSRLARNPQLYTLLARPILDMPILDMLDKKGLQVYRYWDERPQPVRAANPDIVSIIYSVPGKAAVAAITSYAEKEQDAGIFVDAKALGFADGCMVTNAEGGAQRPVENGMILLPLKKHELKVLRLSSKGGQ